MINVVEFTYSAWPQHVQEGVQGWHQVLTHRCIAYLGYVRVSSFCVGFSMAEQQHTAASDDTQSGRVLSNQQLQELMTKTARKTVAEFAWASQPPVSETNATAEDSGLLNA